MRPEGHLDKARAFEERAARWESARDAPSVIEGIFDAMIHYVAYAINVKYSKDIDSHTAQKRFLREMKETDVLGSYESLEQIRISSVYGGSWNGDRIKKAMARLKEIKKWTDKAGK